MKKILLIVILILITSSISFAESLLETQLNRGIKNSEAYSYLLIENAKRDKSNAKEILKKALEYSPDLPAVYFEMAKVSFAFNYEDAFKSIDYIIKGIGAYERNFWWLFTMITSLFISVIISLIFSIFIITSLRLPQDIFLISHDLSENKRKLMLFLIFIFAILNPLYFLAALLILLSLYVRKRDKFLVYFYLIFLLISPLIYKIILLSINASISPEVKAVVEVNEEKYNNYGISILKDKNEPAELFSYALALKREKRFQEAIDVYNRLLSIKQDARIYNNIANCYVGLGDLEVAKELYKKALEIKPLVSTYYNLSQVYRETFDFDNGERYFISAQQLDINSVLYFRKIFGRDPNRFVIDEKLSQSEIWQYAFKRSTGYPYGLSIIPSILLVPISAIMMLIFFVLDKRLKNRAYRCNRCGTIMCNKCEKHILWGHMCLQCYRSLVKLEELDAKERIARILAVYEYRKKKRERIKLLSLLLPGAGQIYAGYSLYGLIFMWPFLFLLFIPLTDLVFNIGLFGFSHIWLNICAIFLMLMVYSFSNIITRRRLAKGWL